MPSTWASLYDRYLRRTTYASSKTTLLRTPLPRPIDGHGATITQQHVLGKPIRPWLPHSTRPVLHDDAILWRTAGADLENAHRLFPKLPLDPLHDATLRAVARWRGGIRIETLAVVEWLASRAIPAHALGVVQVHRRLSACRRRAPRPFP